MPLIYDAIEEYISTAVQGCRAYLLIVCPFIKVAPLRRVIGGVASDVRVEIITTWKLSNFSAGASDVEIFDYCKEAGIRLLANNRIHLKTWLIDDTQLLGTSANITDSAFGLSAKPNYEFLTDTTASSSDRAAHASIFEESVDVTEEMYVKAVSLLKKMEPEKVTEIDLIDSKPCLVSLVDHIPRCADPEELYRFYVGSTADLNEDAIHDLECLRIPPSLNRDMFLSAVQRSFFRLPIISRVCDRLIEAPMFFGEMKEFLQAINDSDPKPTRRALTPITQNLYRWLTALKPDVFVVERPNYSERLFMTEGSDGDRSKP